MSEECPQCGTPGTRYDGALGKTAYECPDCGARWARDHTGYLLWMTSPLDAADIEETHD